MNRKRAVFLDRDGTINVDSGYLSNPDSIEIIPGVIEGLKLLKQGGFKLIVVSNQSGVGRGYFDLETMHAVDHRVKKLTGFLIDASYYCPHHPDENCGCRKPKTGLIEKAINDCRIDKDKSYAMGDKYTDLAAGRRASFKTVMVPKNGETLNEIPDESLVDYVAENFYQGAQWIAKDSRR
jgi:D,D-heptose 1,7-bisphosphate phosphatase